MGTITPSKQQQAIIDAPIDRDVLVVAGAGSGKTFTMTQRIIHLIQQGVPPEHILGLTFTKKAAGELLTRVSDAVIHNAHHGQSSLFMKPDVSTYDAFFQSIVRQYGLLVGFDQQTQPLSEAGAMQLITEVVGAHMDIVRESGEQFSSFSEIVRGVYALSNNIANAMIGDDCESMQAAVERIRAWDIRFIERIDSMLEGEEIPQTPPKDAKVPKRPKTETAAYLRRLAEYEEKHEAFLSGMPLYQCAQLRTVARKREVLLTFVELYAQAKRERHMAEFSDFTIAAFQLVSRFPSIGARYRRRYTHVLLDEYQDTSTTQSALLAKLFHASSTDTSAVSAVGDPYQAIYAFRGASPGAFCQFQKAFGMDEHTSKPLPLSETRRNSRIVLEAANMLTSALDPENRSNATRKKSSARLHEVSVQPLSNVTDGSALVEEGTLGVLGYELFGQEVDGIVRFVQEAIALHTPATLEENADEHRPHVAVLFRSKQHIPTVQAALEQVGLTTLAVGTSALLERPEIIDLLSLLHVIADHADSAGLLRLLATARFGVGARDLQILANIADKRNLEYRYRALVQAGIGDPDADYATQRKLVREHAEKVPNAVFIADVLMDDAADAIIQASQLSDHAKHAVKQAGIVLQQVQRAAYQPIAQVVRTAVEALNLDIDMALAAQLHASDGHEILTDSSTTAMNTAAARAPIDALLATVDTYMQEIAVTQTATLRGYLAWIDAMKTINEDNQVAPDVPVDVVLMTVHQAKGLEWDAVAVVDLRAGKFPSNQGDDLAIEAQPASGDEEIIATSSQYTVPVYKEQAKTWLSDPTAVPVPMRVDADILPLFPRNLQEGDDPIEALEEFDDPVGLDDEVFGSLREAQLAGGESSLADASKWALTQEEEYGRRAHEDERRLMYVALTRARSEALLTFSMYSDVERFIDEEKTRAGAAPSNFWQEVFDVMKHKSGIVTTPTSLSNTQSTEDEPTLASQDVPLPQGFFIGEHAQEFEDAVVGQAWNTPYETGHSHIDLPWPFALSEPLQKRLLNGLSQVQERIADVQKKEKQEELAQTNKQELAEQKKTPDVQSAGILLSHAQKIVNDADLGLSPDLSKEELTQKLHEKAQRILQGKRLNVTEIQANANASRDWDRRQFAYAVLRPIPQTSSPAALAGTRFHAWAEEYMTAGQVGTLVTREALAEDVRRASERIDSTTSQDERDLLSWKRRLIESPWAQRELQSAEQNIVVALDGIDNLVQGKFDAIFYGGLDASNTEKRFTIVDWKTGQRPYKREDITQKLKQLDLYRLLLSIEKDVPLEAIDAALYYLSEEDENKRQIVAEQKTREQIMAELQEGIPQVSDLD